MKKPPVALSLLMPLLLIAGCSANQGLPVDESKTSSCQVEIVEPNGFATQNEITLGDKWWVTIGDIENTCSDVLTLKGVQLASVQMPSDVTFLEAALVVEDPSDSATNPMVWAWPFKESENFTELVDFELEPGKAAGIAVLVELTPVGGKEALTALNVIPDLTTPDFEVNLVNESGEVFKLIAQHTVTFSTEAAKL